jgi:peptidyl-prolyl cis-trans isomerase C
VSTWLREPLLHFVGIGLLLFLGYRVLHPKADEREESTRIEITADDLRQLELGWRSQGRPAPTPEELRRLVESRVREEILYREALALGLEQGDTIVKRRLAQKMEFLFEDVAALREPTPEELAAWYEQHRAEFEQPARATFGHLYFSPDGRGGNARDAATTALRKAAGQPLDWPGGAALADPFMFQDWYGDRSFDDVAKAFGPDFARALFRSTPGAWSGPIESGYGWHLVWVDSITPAHVPPLAEVAAEVEVAWTEAQRSEIREQAYAAMRGRYEVLVPEELP